MRAGVALAAFVSLASAGITRRTPDDDGADDTGSSTNKEGGKVFIHPGRAGGSQQLYMNEECYDEANNPVVYTDNHDKSWIQLNQTDVNWDGGNAGQNEFTGDYSSTNWYFDKYDAYFNGSVTITLSPPPGAPCLEVSTQRIPYYYFRIGMMQREGSKYDRKKYDDNPYYFRIGRTTLHEEDRFECQFTPQKMFASLESSNNDLKYNKVWTVKSELKDDHYEVSGNVTTEYASENNYFNVLPLATSNASMTDRCPSHFYMATLNKEDKVGFNGTVNEKEAKLNWYLTDSETGWSFAAEFNGTAWDKGAQLDMSGKPQQITTKGEAERIDGDRDDDSFLEEHKTGITAGAVVGGLAILALIGALAFFAFSKYKKRQYSQARQMDHDDAFAMDDHQHEREFKDGAMATSMKPMPSRENLLYDQDTSYDAHRSHSPDPGRLPPYTEAYTPLKH